MGDKEDYLTSYRMFFEYFAATVDPEDQLPVQIAGYTITESELSGEVLHWVTQYLSQKQCPATLLSPLRKLILDDVRIASKKHPLEFGYKAEQGVYEALRLMQAVTARANDICLRHLDNSRLDSLPAPPLKAKEIKTVSCAAKNSRRVMEDRHVEVPSLEDMFGIETTEPTSFYAVYDGHAGSAAATYSAIHLHQYLVESPHFTTDLQGAMIEAFLRTDSEFVRKSNQELACGGSTAVAIAVRGNKLLAAWAGDSLALLAKRMRLLQLVCAHKPDRPDEKERIESSGGTVIFWGTWRVNGQLAVSRAIGDAQYKPYVTARPEVATVNLDGDEDFVVVACDGLWDFVSEDEVALTVYRQITMDPDDLNAVTKRLIAQAKRQGSTDNISVIVVFLKDPHAIAADNAPPMDLGLDSALANGPPPFPTDNEACKRPMEAAAVVVDSCDHDLGDNDNGVDNSDSDSEDLGPETAVDADDVDAETRDQEANAVTPLAHIEEARHVEGAAADNVAESGDDSDDEWNYFRGDREPDQSVDQSIDQSVDQSADQPRSETPCQDNSAWESSSVDMNSSPLNPDAPVFVPGGVSDKLLAESPRKPMPMDDIELPDVAQFENEAVARPAELLDLDNCDQLNGHHNISLDEAKEQLNGNMDSLGFGFGSEKDTALLQDFDRIQKDTTDFCNIQVFQTTTETNPFSIEGNDELFERLKNKERDPMSMSFYQEKDDDTCERLLSRPPHVDLNAVQPLPDSDDEDIQTNGVHEHNINEIEKENICIDQNSDILGIERIQEPNNDILRFEGRSDNLEDNSPDFGQSDNLSEFISNANNVQNFAENEFEPNNIIQEVPQTDTPESHKLMFEQIPEIPDGKSSELGFTNEDNLDPSESEKDVRAITPQDVTSQEVELEHKLEETQFEIQLEANADQFLIQTESQPVLSPEPVENEKDEIISEPEIVENHKALTPEPHQPSVQLGIYEAVTPEQTYGNQDIAVEVHQESASEVFEDESNYKEQFDEDEKEVVEPPEITLDEPEPELELENEIVAPSPVPSASPLPERASPALAATSPTPSPLPVHEAGLFESPLIAQSPAPVQSPLPAQSPLPSQSPLPTETIAIPPPTEAAASPMPTEPVASPMPTEPTASPLPAESPLTTEVVASPLLAASPALVEARFPSPAAAFSPAPAVVRSPTPQPDDRQESPAPAASAAPVEEPTIMAASPAPLVDTQPELAEEAAALSPLHAESPLPSEPLPAQSPAPVYEASVDAAPTPDVVPEMRSELVTDLDSGLSESHAQEICVPVTSEIVEPSDATPTPPTPAAVADTPIAADVVPATVAAAAVAAAAATAAGAAKSATKKSPTTPKAPTPKPKSAPARTPLSAAKKPTTPAAAATKPASKPPTPAAKAATPLSKSATPKPAAARPSPSPAKPAPAKPAAALSKPAPKLAAAKQAAKPAAPRSAAPVKDAAAIKMSATTLRAAPRPAAPRSAPAARPAAPRPAPAKPASTPAPRPVAAARPAPRPAPAPARARPEPVKKAPEPAKLRATDTTKKAPERKPISNGDIKPTAKPAPRPAPRAPLAATNKTAAPRTTLDKQSKDLANKKLTARAAPPRTAPPKTAAPPPGSKPAPIRKPADKKAAEIKESTQNGHSEPELKPPPSPTPADNALLPDVIA